MREVVTVPDFTILITMRMHLYVMSTRSFALKLALAVHAEAVAKSLK